MIDRIDVIPIRAERTDASIPPLESVLLRVEDRDGREGWGECATAPAHDGFRVADVLRGLAALPEPPVALDALAAGLEKLAPRARCALETALLDLRGKRQDAPVADLLGGRRRDRVEVNALLPAAPPERVTEAAERAWALGIRTFKLKSGRAADDGRRLASLRARFGSEARLRLDAAGRWTPEEAASRLDALRAFGLEYVEQPVAPGRLEVMAEIARRSAVAVAADEDARDAACVGRIAALGAASAIVVKLPAAGGPAGALEMIEAAHAAGLGVVVTGMMDTAVGLAAALHVAAAAPSLSGACGLGTAALLARDVAARPLPILDGAVALPRGPGLGVRPERARVERLRAGGGGGHG